MSGSIDITGLLNTLYGLGGSTNVASSDPVGAFTRAQADQTKDIALTAKEPATARDIATFRAKVAAATSPAALLKDPTVLKVLLTANGLGGQAAYPALAQKALLSNTKQTSALANQLSNTAWKSTASLFDFANQGLAILKKPSVIDTIANGYAEVQWRQSLDATTPGLSNALTFKEQASSITSLDQILGSSTLRTVVTTALGIPLDIAVQDLGAQEKAISNRLDISKFKDPKFVATFTDRYLLAVNSAGPASSGTPALDQLAASARGLFV